MTRRGMSAGRVFEILRRRTGRAPVVSDDRIPSSWFMRNLVVKAVRLTRGLLQVQAYVFLGPDSRVSGRRHITWGRFVSVGSHCRIVAESTDGVELGDQSRIGDYGRIICTSFPAHLGKGFRLGAGSGFGDFCEFGCAGGVTIGRDVVGGSYVSFHAENHNFGESGEPIRHQGVSHRGIKVGDDVWIGAKVTFLDGATVGSHSVVAAGAVVAGDFPEYSVIGGVPARVIREIPRPTTATQE